jgi:hypothetical protein
MLPMLPNPAVDDEIDPVTGRKRVRAAVFGADGAATAVTPPVAPSPPPALMLPNRGAIAPGAPLRDAAAPAVASLTGTFSDSDRIVSPASAGAPPSPGSKALNAPDRPVLPALPVTTAPEAPLPSLPPASLNPARSTDTTDSVYTRPGAPLSADRRAAIDADRAKMYANAPRPRLMLPTPPGGAGAAPVAPEVLETARLMGSDNPTVSGPMHDAMEIRDRMATSRRATTTGQSIDQVQRGDATAAALGQMKTAGVNADTLASVGLGAAASAPLVPKAQWFGGARAVSPNVNRGAPGLPPVTQDDVLATMNQSKDPRTGIPKLSYAQAKASLTAQRQAVEMAAAASSDAVSRRNEAQVAELQKRADAIRDKYRPRTETTEVPNTDSTGRVNPLNPLRREGRTVNPPLSDLDKQELDRIERDMASLRGGPPAAGAGGVFAERLTPDGTGVVLTDGTTVSRAEAAKRGIKSKPK